MARGYADVSLLGNVAKEPVFKQTTTGKSYCRFPIAIENRYRSSTGSWEKETEFFNLVAWGKIAEFCQAHVKKGTRLFAKAHPKNFRSADSGVTFTFFTISFLNIERAAGAKKTEDDAATNTITQDPNEEEAKNLTVLPETNEEVQAIYFDEEDYENL